MRTVCLIGVEHPYQTGRISHRDRMFGRAELATTQLGEFRALLKATVVRHDLKGIGEEMHPAALRKNYGVETDSVPHEVAAELGLPHRYCDPDIATRKKEGIEGDDEARERYWMRQIEKFGVFPLLFIAGACHIESFGRLLRVSCCEPVVIESDWQPIST